MGEEIIELYFAACNDRNTAAIRNMLRDDIEWTAPGGVVLHGPDQVVAYLNAYFEAFPDIRYDLDRYCIGESVGAFDATLSGTHMVTLHTPGGDLPPTGRKVEVKFAAVMDLVDGQIAGKRIYFDVLEFLTLLGVPAQLVQA